MRLQLLCLVFALTLSSPPAHAARWAVGDSSLPELDALAVAVDKAITKAATKAPAFKKGLEVRLLIACTEGGCSPSITATNMVSEQVEEVLDWSSRWILPVTTPGLAVAVRVWWDKPRKGEKKEKLKPGESPTRPPPGLFWALGFEPSALGGLALEEVLRAERLVFSSAAEVCTEEVAALRAGHGSTTLWHVDIAASGAVQATPQDQYVPPVDPKQQKKDEAAAAVGALTGVDADASPVISGIGVGGSPVVPRELTALETCLAFKLGTARFKGGGEASSSVDRLPVTVLP